MTFFTRDILVNYFELCIKFYHIFTQQYFHDFNCEVVTFCKAFPAVC